MFIFLFYFVFLLFQELVAIKVLVIYNAVSFLLAFSLRKEGRGKDSVLSHPVLLPTLT